MSELDAVIGQNRVIGDSLDQVTQEDLCYCSVWLFM